MSYVQEIDAWRHLLERNLQSSLGGSLVAVRGMMVMVVTRAIYSLSEIQRVDQTGVRERRSGRSVTTSSPPTQRADEIFQSAPPTTTGEEPQTLRQMLFRHFVEEVRLRDRDGDGRLSRREFGGEQEEFHAVDTDGDGFVTAGDLCCASLARSADLQELIVSPRTTIYEALLGVIKPTAENLLNAVKAGASDAARTVGEGADGEGETENQVSSNPDAIADEDAPSASTSDRIAKAFLDMHPSLLQLHQRLRRLAAHLGQTRRYPPIDLVG